MKRSEEAEAHMGAVHEALSGEASAGAFAGAAGDARAEADGAAAAEVDERVDRAMGDKAAADRATDDRAARDGFCDSAREVHVREYRDDDIAAMRAIWNEVVRGGAAFPQIDELSDENEARAFFGFQTTCAVAEAQGRVLGLYILHPNNVGRCGHIANTSYAVASAARGMHIGERLVRDSLTRARDCGFRVLQFNAVVASNASALHLYQKVGFTQLGSIPGGFLNKDGVYEDIIPHYYDLTKL